MCLHIQQLTSKINLLNGHIGQLHDSGLFNPEETSNLSAPLVLRVHEIQNKIREIKAKDIQVVGAEIVTPQTNL